MQVKSIVSLWLIVCTTFVKAQTPDDILNYINTYKEIAMFEMQRTGVPAAIKLAQGIHETQAGTSELVKKSNNHFGIKCKDSWRGERVFHDDDARGECFRSYLKPEQSYKDHSDFLKSSPRYSFLFQLDPTDYKAWATGLKKAGYATNYKYAQIIVKLIEDYNLEQYTLIAMGKLPATDEVIASNANTSSIVTQAIKPSGVVSKPETKEVIEIKKIKIQPVYPDGEFTINNTRVVFVKAGTALLTVAEEYNIPFARLMDFNDLLNADVLKEDQLVFLQRKRKIGPNEFHIVQEGETLYDICQSEAVRLESMLAYNFLRQDMHPVVGEKLYLQHMAASRPAIEEERNNSPETKTESMKLPEAATHVVQTKETVFSISKKYGISAEQLKEWNRLDSTELKIGQQLVIQKKE